MFGFGYPYTNLHNLNLDWIVGEVNSIPAKVNAAVEKLKINSGSVFNAVAEGFDNSGAVDNTQSWRDKIVSPGVFFFPPGTYLFSEEISIPSGAAIVGLGDCTFRFLNHGIWSRYVDHVSIINIHVTGAKNRGIFFRDSHHITLDGCRITNMIWEERAYHTAFISCHDVYITNHYVNSSSENSDGINLSYDNYNVVIDNFSGVCNDDFIAINPGATGSAESTLWARNIVVRNAICDTGTYRGLRLYANVGGGIENVTVESCVFRTLQNESVVIDNANGGSANISASFVGCKLIGLENESESLIGRTYGVVSFSNCEFMGLPPYIYGNFSFHNCEFFGGSSTGLVRCEGAGEYYFAGCVFDTSDSYNSIFSQHAEAALTVIGCKGQLVRVTNASVLTMIGNNMGVDCNMVDGLVSFVTNNVSDRLRAPSPQSFSTLDTLPSVASAGSTCIVGGVAYIAKTANTWTEIA